MYCRVQHTGYFENAAGGESSSGVHAWERVMGISFGRSTSPASQSLTGPSVLVARARVGLAPRGCRDTSCSSAPHTRFLHATAVHAAARTAVHTAKHTSGTADFARLENRRSQPPGVT